MNNTTLYSSFYILYLNINILKKILMHLNVYALIKIQENYWL